MGLKLSLNELDFKLALASIGRGTIRLEPETIRPDTAACKVAIKQSLSKYAGNSYLRYLSQIFMSLSLINLLVPRTVLYVHRTIPTASSCIQLSARYTT